MTISPVGFYFRPAAAAEAPSEIPESITQELTLQPSAAAVAPSPLPTTAALSFTDARITDVRVRGLKRIEKEAVLAKIPLKRGELLTSESVREAIRAVFRLGFFDDVTVELTKTASQRVRVWIVVRERPVIAELNFAGNDRISTHDLRDVVKLKEWSILDIHKVQQDVLRIQKHYEEKGFYLARVSYEIKPLSDEEVELIYRVQDYDKVQIKKITFLNNHQFTDEQLKSVLADTREGGLLSALNSSGNFKESAFKQDLQRLSLWYLDHGFIKFKLDHPVVTMSDDKKWLFISLYLEEGERYRIGELEVSGDLLFPKDELLHDLKLQHDEVFSISNRNADIQALTEKYQDLGYAFVNVIPKMNVHEDSKRIDLDYGFEKGYLAYLGEINIINNTKTQDRVIRRELKIVEGELFNGTRMRISRENVERLGYFAPGEVSFNTVPQKDHPHVLNVEISVKERSTGTVTLGAGFGSVQGPFFTTQISEINVLGQGQTISLAAQYSISQLSQSFNLGFTEPYTFDSRWVTGADLYHVKVPIPYRWNTQKSGADVKLGHPISDYTNVFLTYKFEGIRDLAIDGIDGVDKAFLFSQMNADHGILSSLVLSVVRDQRNNRFETTGGSYQSLSTEFAGLGGDLAFAKTVFNNRFYHRVIGDLVFRTNLEVGQLVNLRPGITPPSQRFYLGGPNNMKGFQLFQLGPQLPPASIGNQPVPQPTGGDFEAFSLFELEYPILKDAGVKLVLFYDIGNSWNSWPLNAPLMMDAGFGLRWFSPIGPLRFEWGFPLNAPAGNPSPVFQFFIGPPF